MPVLRLVNFLKSMLMIVDMVTDAKTTILYYDYGVNPSKFKPIQENDTYIHLNLSNTLSTVEPSSVSTDLSFFYIACVIWAINPIMHARMIVKWLNQSLINDDWLDMLEEKFGNYSSIREKFKNQPIWSKILFVIATSPILFLMGIIWAYFIDPLTIILIALGNLFPVCFNKLFIKKLSAAVKYIKISEAIYESLGQWILAMVFYSYNKEYYNHPKSYMPWVTEGMMVVISMHFSWLSIVLTHNYYNNELFTLLYGKDWWKLWKRTKVLQRLWFYLALTIILHSATIGIFIWNVYL